MQEIKDSVIITEISTHFFQATTKEEIVKRIENIIGPTKAYLKASIILDVVEYPQLSQSGYNSSTEGAHSLD